MRVVIVSDFASVNGGAAKVAIESARGLAEAGVDVVFAAAIAPVSERLSHPRIAVELFGADEVWKVAGKLAAVRQGIWNEAAHGWLEALLSRQPAGAIVHLHQWTKAFSPAAVAAAGASGLPVIITMHDYFSFCPAGGYFDFQAGRPCDRKPMGAACIGANCDRSSYAHKLVRVARQWRSDRALGACRDLTFCHVSAFARRFAEPFLPQHARHVTIENMMEAGDHRQVDVGPNRHALYVGRLTAEKGVLLLAEAARLADMPVRFVGDGPMADAIRMANPDAEMVGWVAPDKVASEFARARVLVAPSLWFETGPMTVVEAAAIGVPAIVSDRMGAADWVVDGITGRHVRQADLQDLVAALREAAEPVAANWGAAAHARHWARPPSLALHATRLLDLYGKGAAVREAA
jgi:glycosyltransferase involved in cell wall biosynthesis